EKMGVSEEDEPQIHTAHILIKAPQTDTPTLQVEGNTAEGGIVNATVEGQEELQGKKDEARKQAEKVLQELQTDPLRFAELAQEYSEDEGSAVKGGDLGYAVPSTYVQAYREAALALEPGETTSELVESEFGFHIIKLIDLKNPDDLRFKYSALQVCYQGASGCDSQLSKEEAQTKADELLRRVREEKIYSVERVWFNAVPDPWQETELDGRYFKHASVAYDQTNNRPYVAITFNGEGAKLFEELTEANIGKPIGIFVGGEFISSPTVQEKIAGGNAQITLGQPNPQLALKEANELARSLNAGSIPAPLKKPNELTIGASLGQQSLEKSIQAGLIGFLLLASFMILYYRFLGVLACLSLLIYGLLLVFVIQSEISPALAILFTFVLWIAFALRLFKSKIDFFAKCIFLTLSIVGVYFIFSVLVNPIVLTLAGVAGLILSISMAIDANILIYERMKEEFRAGKSFVSVVHDGFERAWSSILDSNVSTLITCGILNYFGSSFIRGFAVNLAIGIVISMFTAVTVSRIFLLLCHDTKLERISWLWKK
ncbi:MAG: peptidylprolyl isomerase, partial [bacterium]|nr:peptidylprolyl isomerase [bacterium]